MELQQSVWDFSTPSMDQIDLQSLSSSDDNDVQRALDLFDLPKAPSLLNCDADNFSLDSFRPRSSNDTTETDKPSRRVRRDASVEQKQASNREHQRRFRMRSKARSQAIEAQLANTTAELQTLRSRYQQLETMLARASQTRQDTLAQTPSSEANRSTQSHFRCKDLDLSPLLSVSIQGKIAHLTAEEVKIMPAPQFSALWTAYIHELGQCLLQLDDDRVGYVAERMMTLSVEGMRLIGRRLLCNPAAHKALITGSLAQGAHTLLCLDGRFYTKLLGLLELSAAQVVDLMHLRRLYLTKRGLLVLQRKELVRSIADADAEHLVHPSDNCAKAADVAVSLQENVFQDQQVLYRIARATWCGVLSVRQLALVMVHAYPYMPILEPFLDTLAANHGYPSNSDVASTAAPMMAEWRDFDAYSNHLQNTMFALKERSPYIPLSRHVAPHSEGRSALPVSATPAMHCFVLT
ncbi:hypothetical protein WJX77_010507 [Trebouxia sp. C0004]